jgi:hypothetical protein
MKLILPLYSLIHCHIIKSAHMTAYLISMKPPQRRALEQLLWWAASWLNDDVEERCEVGCKL